MGSKIPVQLVQQNMQPVQLVAFATSVRVFVSTKVKMKVERVEAGSCVRARRLSMLIVAVGSSSCTVEVDMNVSVHRSQIRDAAYSVDTSSAQRRSTLIILITTCSSAWEFESEVSLFWVHQGFMTSSNTKNDSSNGTFWKKRRLLTKSCIYNPVKIRRPLQQSVNGFVLCLARYRRSIVCKYSHIENSFVAIMAKGDFPYTFHVLLIC